MPDILEYWILEFELEPEKNLSPVRLLRIGEDPTIVIFGLYNEHTEPRYEDVVNLSCAILHLKGNVIHKVIIRRGEVPLRNVGQQHFSTILECCGTGSTVAANDEAN